MPAGTLSSGSFLLYFCSLDQIRNNMSLETKLLKITARGRYRMMREIWNHSGSAATHRDLIIRELTFLRKEIFETIISSDILSVPLCREIADDEGMPQVKKNICILAIYGIDARCIADLNCVNIGYVRMCIKSLKEEYTELFR